MSRGGYISVSVYLTRAYERNISLKEATEAAREALLLGKLICKGRRPFPAIARLEMVTKGGKVRRLISPLEEIPSPYWGDSGFITPGAIDDQYWDDVRLNERQCSELLNRLEVKQPRALPEDSVQNANERRRSASWDQWVAVVATLAYEQLIGPNSTDRDILQLAAARLGIRHQPEKQTKRMKYAALAIMAHWKTNPPQPPAPTQLTFRDPTSKP